MEFSAVRLITFAGLVILGTLNREMTGVLLWLVFVGAYPRRWQWWLLYGVLLAGTLLLLRVLIPATPSPYTTSHVWQLNLTPWRLQGAVQYLALLLPLWILLYHQAGYQTRATYRRMMLVVIVPYLALVALLGVWQEVRLLMPLFILGVPFLRDEKPK